jgi:hypothetical protein
MCPKHESNCAFADKGFCAGERKKTEVALCVNCSLKLSDLSEYCSGPTVVCNVLQILAFGQMFSLVLGLFSTWIQNDGRSDLLCDPHAN